MKFPKLQRLLLIAASFVIAPSAKAETSIAAAGLLQKYQCGRCHELPADVTPFPRRQSCVGCHTAILEGQLDSDTSAEDIARWKSRLRSFTVVPSLEHRQLRSDWIRDFLLHPHSVRHKLGSYMPRMPISEAEATILGEALGQPEANAFPTENSSAGNGANVLETMKCLNCHQFSTRPSRQAAEPGHESFQRIAPDLAHARVRLSERALRAFLTDPQTAQPGTKMPNPNLTPTQIDALTRLLLSTPTPVNQHIVERIIPAKLARTVRFAEVNERILDKVCRHCHGNERAAPLDAGPGNTGGFGYPGKALDLSSEFGVRRGVLDRNTNERKSVIAPEADGVPRLVKVLLARHQELHGEPDPEVLGMPLGLEPLPVGDINLMFTWCLQQSGH